MWVPLHVHSQYSVLDAAASIQDIASKAAAYGMPAVALTDHGNLYGIVDFYKACKDAKVKPILGCEVYVAPGSRFEKSREYGEKTAFHLVLLAKNDEGYHNLCRLSSIGFLEGFYYHPRIDREVLKKYKSGLICLSACLSGHVAQEALRGTDASFCDAVRWYHDLFGDDYYLELQRFHMSDEDIVNDGYPQELWLQQQYRDFIAKQEKVNKALIAIAREQNIPLVATNDSHYIDRSDWKAHEILLNIQSGEPCETLEHDSFGNVKARIPNPKRRTYPSHECYFKSPEQMRILFSDVPEAISNTLAVAEKCHVDLDFNARHYPVYVPPTLHDKTYTTEERARAVESFLWQLCEDGIPKRYTPERLSKVKEIYPDRDSMAVIRERLQYEMSVIVPKGMCDYLLIVWDFIHWAKNHGIPMGPGRGSGAGSIVLYLIGITDIEPLRFHLFFERFINPERVSYPDIDVDMCMDKRGEVISYTLQKYGREMVAQIITFGTMRAKSSIKDVGRVLNVPLAKVNSIAKLVPDDLNITLEKALEKDHELQALYGRDEDTRRIIDIGKKLEGSIRSTGIHAAGLVISGQPLVDLIPVCVAKDSNMPVTQYSMKPIELVGMLKIDFLGLKTLTAIQICVDAIKASTGKEIDWVNLPLDDKPTFELLNQGKTAGVFQLESEGMQELSRNLHLDRFEEIIAVGALYRPGPMDMIPSFINRKHGREPIDYDHPWMKDILSETYGIMVYQEQVMQIASKLAGYTLGEGDVLRRAMGKKDADQMAKQREKFRLGALKNGIEESLSMLIFDKVEKFASYGFNKSHAAAYGYLSYVTAYLKANYPTVWMAALLTCDSGDITLIAKFIRECQSMNIAVLPPDVNEAGARFVATPQGIRFAMMAIKGMGTGMVEAILAERRKGGPFTSLYQFFSRVDATKITKKGVECLIDAGSFDWTGWSRDALRMSVEPMYDAVAHKQKEASSGILSLFSKLGDIDEKRFAQPPAVGKGRSRLELLLREKELLGFFLTGHPLDDYRSILKRLSCAPLSRVPEMNDGYVFRTAVIIEEVVVRLAAKTQTKFAILTASDGFEHYEMMVWSDLYETKGHLLTENHLLYMVVEVDKKTEESRLVCRWLDDLSKADEAMIQACDQAYDLAKTQTARRSKMRKGDNRMSHKAPTEKTEKPVAAPKPNQPFSLHVEIDHMRHTEVLRLKEIFARHRGNTPVTLRFHAPQGPWATIHIDTPWGIQPNPQLLKELEAIASIRIIC